MMETVLFDNLTSNTVAIGGATGAQYLVTRNSHVGEMQVSPRQWRSILTFHDGTNDGSWVGSGSTFYGPPVTEAFNGPLGYWDFGTLGACQFSKGSDSHVFYAGNSDASLVIGTDAVWSTLQLQIPNSFSNFQKWLIYATAGTILSTTNNSVITTGWGYVNSCSSDGANHLYLNVVWVSGSKPTSGTLYIYRYRRLDFAATNTLNSPILWQSPGPMKLVASPFATNYGFPTGYPPPFNE
jgi:hypothetical protein